MKSATHLFSFQPIQPRTWDLYGVLRKVLKEECYPLHLERAAVPAVTLRLAKPQVAELLPSPKHHPVEDSGSAR